MPEEAAITADHKWFTGAKKTIAFDIATDEDTSGWTCVWALRKSPTENDVLLEIVTGSQLVGAGDVITLTITAADTQDLEPGEYAHALKRTDADEETILTYGDATLMQAAAH